MEIKLQIDSAITNSVIVSKSIPVQIHGVSNIIVEVIEGKVHIYPFSEEKKKEVCDRYCIQKHGLTTDAYYNQERINYIIKDDKTGSVEKALNKTIRSIKE